MFEGLRSRWITLQVGVVEGLRHLRDNLCGQRGLKDTALAKEGFERPARHDLHGEVRNPAHVATVVDADDVWMVQCAANLGLTRKTLQELGIPKERRQGPFQRANLSVVLRFEHDGHAAFPEGLKQQIRPEPVPCALEAASEPCDLPRFNPAVGRRLLWRVCNAPARAHPAIGAEPGQHEQGQAQGDDARRAAPCGRLVDSRLIGICER